MSHRSAAHGSYPAPVAPESSCTAHRGGRGEIAIPSDEVIATRGVAGERLADPRERHAGREVGRKEVLREQRAADRIVPRVKLMPRLLLLGAEHQFDVARERETASRCAAIRDSEMVILTASLTRNAHRELGDDVTARVREACHAGRVCRLDIAANGARRRQPRWVPVSAST